MTYHRPLFTGNVLKVRLSCVKLSEKNRGKNQQNNHGKGKKNQDRGRIYTPAHFKIKLKFDTTIRASISQFLNEYIHIHNV